MIISVNAKKAFNTLEHLFLLLKKPHWIKLKQEGRKEEMDGEREGRKEGRRKGKQKSKSQRNIEVSEILKKE